MLHKCLGMSEASFFHECDSMNESQRFDEGET